MLQSDPLMALKKIQQKISVKRFQKFPKIRNKNSKFLECFIGNLVLFIIYIGLNNLLFYNHCKNGKEKE